MKYLGLLSKFDAMVLEAYGRWASSTLEFGMGGSTMIFAQTGTKLYSMEPDPFWIETTQKRLDELKIPKSGYKLMPYDLSAVNNGNIYFDLIFVDGTADQRFPFALAAFPKLKLGGWMLFHDTRWKPDLRNMLDVMLAYQNEISNCKLNMDHSNISGFQRKVAEPFYEWSKAEGRTRWMDGLEEPPENWPDLLEKK